MSRQQSRLVCNRREALAAGCALAGTLGLSSSAHALGSHSTTQAPSFGPFKLGIQSYSLRGLTNGGRPDLKKALAATKDLGVHYWESYTAHVPIVTHPQGIAELKRELKLSDVTLAGYGVVRFGSDADANRRIFEFAKAFGLDYVSADPDPASLDGLDKLVEKFDVAVGIHNHGPGHRYDQIDAIKKAIENHHAKIGCCVDTGHFLRSKVDPVDAVEAFGKRVYGVHLKDVKDAKTFTVLGKGDLRTVDLLKALVRARYNYCVAIEYEEKPENPLEDIKACLAEAGRAIAEATKT